MAPSKLTTLQGLAMEQEVCRQYILSTVSLKREDTGLNGYEVEYYQDIQKFQRTHKIFKSIKVFSIIDVPCYIFRHIFIT